MRKLIRTRTLLAILLSAFTAATSFASLNLMLNMATAHQLGVTLANGDEYTIATSGTDPYISTTGLSRSLSADEVVLVFEYCSTADIDMLQLFFGPSYSEARSKRCKSIPVSAGWKTFTVNIASEIKQFGWGQQSSIMRLDFGSRSGVGIKLRHLRIAAVGDQGWNNDLKNLDLAQTIALGLPVLNITTVNAEEPTCTPVAAPEGSIGAGITNATKVPGRVVRYEPNGEVSFDSEDYVKGETGMTIKIRGNTSAYQSRKPYKIKLQSKADLLCRGDKKFKDKNWVLLNDYEMMLRNGLWVNELIGMDWTPQCQYVNVLFNNEFRGVYLLCEAVERNTDCRIDVSKTGFVTELDAYWWNEDGAYVASSYSPVWNYTFKYPDYEDMDAESIQYVAQTMAQMEAALANNTYASVIDCESFAKWLMGHDILGTLDYGGSNMYYSKYDNTPESKIRRPTMWDFDSSERLPDTWSNSHLNHHNSLFTSTVMHFKKAFANVWHRNGQYVFDIMAQRLSSFQQSPEAAAYDKSIEATNSHWGFNYSSSKTYTNRSLSWYASRKTWMTQMMAPFKPLIDEDVTGLDNVAADRASHISVFGNRIVSVTGTPFKVTSVAGRLVADSQGEQVEIPAPGLYIVVSAGAVDKVVVR
ncbi:MAG: CotH kinase family protein [Muribaculum sp.]|nr:CotH kinase family protein [Muribaculaceae bacterium]MCM1080281.1 CotH kinase family protein [Muribaculum sp.]